MKVFVAEITGKQKLSEGDSYVTKTWYVCSFEGLGWTTLPTDTPPDEFIPNKLSNAGSWTRESFSGSNAFGLVRPGVGNVTLVNGDGYYDDMINWAFDGQPFAVRYFEEGDPYPVGNDKVVFKCSMAQLKPGFNNIEIQLRDRTELFNKSVITHKFLGTGDEEGPTELAGTACPRLFGNSRYLPLKLLKEADLLYWMHEEIPESGDVFVWDGGVLLDRGADYTDVADMLANSPAEGEFRCLITGPSYLRLGSPLVYDGFFNSHGVSEDGAIRMSDLALEAGMSEITSSYGTAIDNAYIDDAKTTYMDILNEHAKVQNLFFGMTRLDEFQCVQFQEPSGTPVYQFTQFNTIKIEQRPTTGISLPVFQVSSKSFKNYMHNAKLSNSEDIAASFRDNIAKDYFFGNSSTVDEGVKALHLMSKDLVIECNQQLTDDDVSNYKDLFGQERRLVDIDAQFSEALRVLDLNDCVSVQTERYDYADAKLFRIVKVDLNLTAQRVNFTLWGPQLGTEEA